MSNSIKRSVLLALGVSALVLSACGKAEDAAAKSVDKAAAAKEMMVDAKGEVAKGLDGAVDQAKDMLSAKAAKVLARLEMSDADKQAMEARLTKLTKLTFSAWDEAEYANESDKANAFFETAFNFGVDRSPTYQSYLGIKKDYGKWDDGSQERAQEDLMLTKIGLQTIKDSIDFDKLDEQTKISYRLYVDDAEREIKNFKYRFHNYPVNQMFGVQSGAPAFLINIHRVTDVSDAKAYISRLNGFTQRINDVVNGLSTRTQMGIVAPKFVYPYVINDSKNIIQGKPFDESGEDSTLLADFKKKVSALEIEQSKKDSLIAEASDALVNSVKPAYELLIKSIQKMERVANTDDGAWKLPNGADFYDMALANTTTTALTANEIHDIGLKEVERIHGEMREIMQTVKFDGDLQAFFEFMRTDKQFYKPETDAGREEYLQENRDLINNMKSRLDELFLTKPKADLDVKRVEPFREKSAGKAFYNRPAADGSRPGIYYANLYEMSQMPTYQMEALAYHEGIPGHHMQLAISQELEGIPKFRKFGGYTAHTEGWGLYSEYLPKEIGLYEDPYSDFGRLAMELWRACRLVVDTGIHSKKWTREEGIKYYSTNTPNPYDDAVKMVERHVVMPSQATAYKIGMLKILELREASKKKLGDKFDIREFHDVVITNGALPLNVLEQLVDEWVASKA